MIADAAPFFFAGENVKIYNNIIHSEDNSVNVPFTEEFDKNLETI